MRMILIMVGVSGASSNHELVPRLADLNSIRERRSATIPPDTPVVLSHNPTPRPLPVTRTVEQILVKSGCPMRRAEIQDLVESIFETKVPRSTVKNALANLATSPISQVRRVGHGQYLATDGTQSSGASKSFK